MGMLDRFTRTTGSEAASSPSTACCPTCARRPGTFSSSSCILTTLLVSIAGEFIAVAQVNIGYGQKLKNQLKAGYLAKSGIQMAQFILYADLKGVTTEMLTGKPTDKEIDSYNDLWAINFPAIPLEDGSLKIQISDENAKINLSMLANEFTDRTKFYFFTQNFFMNMGLPIDFADIIHDWVDVDDSRMPYGAEGGDYYQSQIPPYNAKNNAMDSIDELLLVKDMTPLIFYGKGGGNFEAEKNEQNIVEHNKGTVDLDLDKIREIVGGRPAQRRRRRQKQGADRHRQGTEQDAVGLLHRVRRPQRLPERFQQDQHKHGLVPGIICVDR